MRSVREIKRAAMIAVHQREGYTARVIAAMNTAQAVAKATEAKRTPAFLEHLRRVNKERFADPLVLEEHRARMKVVMNDPEVAARHRAAYDNPETKAKLAAIAADTIRITDGEKNRHLRAGLPIPDGWYRGVSNYGKRPEARAEAQLLGRHNRWHVKRGIVNLDCRLCSNKPAAAGGS
jgi:hypothetical protein